MKKIFFVAITLLGFSIFKANAQFVRPKPHVACPLSWFPRNGRLLFPCETPQLASELDSQTQKPLARLGIAEILYEAFKSIIVTNVNQYKCKICSYSDLPIKYK